MAWRKGSRGNPEEQLQRAVVEHLRRFAKDRLWHSIPNEAVRSKTSGARMKKMGLLPGAFDMLFVLPNGLAAYLEFKSEKGRLSTSQIAFRDTLITLGIPYAVVNNIDQALLVLRGWGVLPEDKR